MSSVPSRPDEVEMEAAVSDLKQRLTHCRLMVEEAADQSWHRYHQHHLTLERIKTDITETAAALIETIRTREAELKQRADVLGNYHFERLSERRAHLHAVKGGLTALIPHVRALLSERSDETARETILNEIVPSEDRELLSEPSDVYHRDCSSLLAPIEFTCDMEELREHLQSFGKISYNSSQLFKVPSSGRSRIRSKSASSDCCRSSSSALTDNEWLVMESCSVKVPRFELPQQLTSADNELWLHVTNQEDKSHSCSLIGSEFETMEDDESISVIESLEVLSNAENDLLPHQLNPFYQWTSGCSTQLSDSSKMNKIVCCGPSPPNETVDIENLANVTCFKDYYKTLPETSSWLANATEIPSSTQPPVESLCRANEPCQSLSDCIYDDSCAVNALNKSWELLGFPVSTESRIKNLKSDDKRNYFMAFLPDSFNKTEDLFSCNEKIDSPEKSIYKSLSGSDNNYWRAPLFPSMFLPQTTVNQSIDKSNETIDFSLPHLKDFKHYFSQNDLSQWLPVC